MPSIGDAIQLGFMRLVCLTIVERRQCDDEKPRLKTAVA
jgi:hypothetical protein